MQVVVVGVPEVKDRDKNPITDVNTLRKLDGVNLHGDDFTEYLGGPEEQSLIEALEPSGDLALRYESQRAVLLFVTEYTAKRPLLESELETLRRYTEGQWSDGIGSSFNAYCWDNYDTWVDFPSWDANGKLTRATITQS